MNSKNNGFFVVEDHTVTNIGLTSLIGQKTGLVCLGSAFSKSEALKKIRALAESGSEAALMCLGSSDPNTLP